MTILVTGSTGTIGSQIVTRLVKSGADVRALVRDPRKKTSFPSAVTIVKGDMMDVDSMRVALAPVGTLFLLNAVTPDEVTQALMTLNLAYEAGIERIVYFSVIHSDLYTNVPHFAGKHTVERMIEQRNLPATILRPAYFMNNDLSLKDAILGHGVYPMPVGGVGLAMADTGDIADVAVHELLRREHAPEALPRNVIDIVGPDLLTGNALARIWSEVLGRPIAYGGDDTNAYEQTMKAYVPAWMAFDLRLMLDRFQTDGMVPNPGDVERLTALLERPLKSYRAFAAQAAAGWQSKAAA